MLIPNNWPNPKSKLINTYIADGYKIITHAHNLLLI